MINLSTNKDTISSANLCLAAFTSGTLRVSKFSCCIPNLEDNLPFIEGFRFNACCNSF